MRAFHWRLWLLTALLLGGAPGVYADVVTDANQKSADIASRHPATPISVRMMAIVQVSVFEAVNAISGRYPTFRVPMSPAPGASMDAAVAAAMRTALLKLMPAQQAAIDADYQALLAGVPDGPAKASGIAVGEQAATAVLASCANDGSAAPDMYRPHTTPGLYVPTVIPAVPHWGKRKPWVMDRPDQFRPGPPPALTSDTWTRDFNEVKTLGEEQRPAHAGADGDGQVLGGDRARRLLAGSPFGRHRARPRCHGQRAPARGGGDGHGRRAHRGLRREIHLQLLAPGHRHSQRRPRWKRRDHARARLVALHRHTHAPRVSLRPLHRLGRPRRRADSGDQHGADADAELGQLDGGGVVRTWTRVSDFTQEVALARILDGVHYRNSTEVGTAMGMKIGELAVQKLPRATR